MASSVCINHLADTLKNAKTNNRRAFLFIGADCSVKAGIPTASEFLSIIEERYKTKLDHAPRTYPSYMSCLSSGERHDLIAQYVDKARINWAHIAIAQLIKNGYVDRILTTNFDPLVARACALVNEFPAVYDLAASSFFSPDPVFPKAIFHLHGQRSGFVILNTPKECDTHRKYESALRIKPDDHLALNNWGIALFAQAETKPGQEADALLAQANEKLLAARRLSAAQPPSSFQSPDA